MTNAKIADTKPIPVELKADQAVWWCACGRSKTQPFCDGSHRGTEFAPLKFTADTDEKYFFCQCKRSGNPPLCDGSHKQITEKELDADQGLERIWYKVV